MIRVAVSYAFLLGIVVVFADSGMLSEPLLWLHAIPGGDKVVHFVLAGLLALVVNLAIRQRAGASRPASVVPGTLAIAILVTFEELSNLVVPTRSWSLGDLSANHLGVICIGVLPLLIYDALAHRQSQAAWIASGRS